MNKKQIIDKIIWYQEQRIKPKEFFMQFSKEHLLEILKEEDMEYEIDEATE